MIPALRMGSVESHLNVSVGSDGQSHKTAVSTNHSLFEEKEEPKRYRTEVLPLMSLTPSSRMYLWWSLCTLYFHACQAAKVTVGDSGPCCCTCVTRISSANYLPCSVAVGHHRATFVRQARLRRGTDRRRPISSVSLSRRWTEGEQNGETPLHSNDLCVKMGHR